MSRVKPTLPDVSRSRIANLACVWTAVCVCFSIIHGHRSVIWRVYAGLSGEPEVRWDRAENHERAAKKIVSASRAFMA